MKHLHFALFVIFIHLSNTTSSCFMLCWTKHWIKIIWI